MKALYESSKALLEGSTELEGPFADIRDWITDRFQVTPLNVRLRLQNSILSIVFKDYEDRVQFDEASRRLYETVPKSRNDYLKILEKYPDPPQELYLHIDHFQYLALRQVFSNTDMEAFQNDLGLESLWRIYYLGGRKTVFFFYKDHHVKEYMEESKKDLLIQAYYHFLKQQDEFDLLKEEEIYLILDSKEVFEVTYQGSMQYYVRDH